MNANIRRVKKNPAHPSMGDADTTHHEFVTNIRRDKAASSVGHKDILTFQSVALNLHVERVRLNLLESILQPVGPPPKRD